ncbi:MAG: PRC-barrel domain-containing protein [Methanobacteriaceae archaeon]|nr:PRC-barrel domain-containing protein [Methanobacteriaceae archaeon]
MGKEVINSSATVIGKVKDIEINIDNNEIEAIVLGKDGISNSLGLSKEEVVIPFEVVEQVGDRILVKKVEKDEINVDDYYGYLESKIKNIRL